MGRRKTTKREKIFMKTMGLYNTPDIVEGYEEDGSLIIVSNAPEIKEDVCIILKKEQIELLASQLNAYLGNNTDKSLNYNNAINHIKDVCKQWPRRENNSYR